VTEAQRERRRARDQARYAANREKILEKNRVIAKRWIAANQERSRENARRWREENRERHRAATRRWHLENRERDRENARTWLASHPVDRRGNARRYRARKRGATVGDIPCDAEHQLLGFQRGRCAYCHAPLTDYHVDHIIPLARGGAHSWENLVLACPPCNLSKGDKLVEEWM
jgi:5-methylcytosine-specific restriction endonuclease McrA